MTGHEISDELLIAYADGELDDADRAAVEAALAADPKLAEAIDRHRSLRSAVAGAYTGTLDEPVPDALMRAVRGADIVDLAGRRDKANERQRIAWPHWGAIAASLIVGLLAGQMLELGDGQLIEAKGDALVAEGALARELDTQLASAGGQGSIAIGLTFASNSGDYCRTFHTREAGLAGLACRDGDEWRVQMAVADLKSSTSGSGYRMAASETPPAVLDAVQAIIAGDPLDATAERVARDRGWRN